MKYNEGTMIECHKCHSKIAIVGSYNADGVKLEPMPVYHYCLAGHDNIGIHVDSHGIISLDDNYHAKG